MILVDVYVPSLNDTFDMRLNEDNTVEETTHMLCTILDRMTSSAHIYENEYSDAILCDAFQNRILPPKEMIGNCGIGNGSKLILV